MIHTGLKAYPLQCGSALTYSLFEAGFHFVVHVDVKFIILLLQHIKYWDYRPITPLLALPSILMTSVNKITCPR